MDAVTKSLVRISEELPNLGKEELKLVEKCLEDCFETGRTWDSIPILVHEANAPQQRVEKHSRNLSVYTRALSRSVKLHVRKLSRRLKVEL